MIHTQHQTSARTPILPNFAATAAKPAALQSVIEKLVAEYIETHRACDAAFSAMSKAETAAVIPVPAAIRATKASRRDVMDYGLGKTRRPIQTGEISRAINSVKNNTCKREDLPGGLMRLTTSRNFSAKNRVTFPLSPAQKRQIARLEAMLPIAVKYQADCKAAMKAHRCDELRLEAERLSDRLTPIMKKVAKLQSKTLVDVVAKCRLYEFDNELDASSEVALSITRDLQRLHEKGIRCLCGLPV